MAGGTRLVQAVGVESPVPGLGDPVVSKDLPGCQLVHCQRRTQYPAADVRHVGQLEEAVSGREIELAVLGDRVPQVSGPGEIRPGDAFYSYADKYETNSAELIDDPDLDPSVVVGFQELAARAFIALRCSGMARVDFFLADDGRMLVNEVNTIPGFTSISMYPRLWLKAGLSYGGLIDQLVDLAVERHARRRRNTRR